MSISMSISIYISALAVSDSLGLILGKAQMVKMQWYQNIWYDFYIDKKFESSKAAFNLWTQIETN